jgi:hypothetical protein
MGGTLNVIFVTYVHQLVLGGGREGGIRFWIYIPPHLIII